MFLVGSFFLSQMQVNVQVQMQGGVGDSCIFRRIGIWNRLFFVLLVWRMKKKIQSAFVASPIYIKMSSIVHLWYTCIQRNIAWAPKNFPFPRYKYEMK